MITCEDECTAKRGMSKGSGNLFGFVGMSDNGKQSRRNWATKIPIASSLVWKFKVFIVKVSHFKTPFYVVLKEKGVKNFTLSERMRGALGATGRYDQNI